MNKITLPLSLAALAVLAACGTSDPVRPAPAPVVVTPAPTVATPAPASTPAPIVVQQSPGGAATVVVPTPTAIRPGFGRIETITALPQSAAAGGVTARRFGVKMEDGTMQYVDSPAQNISSGDRIELTNDGQMRR